MRSGGMPAGSSRALRLDPFSLPVRFAASDAAADERVRQVELYRERVVVRRSLAGMRMALNMPVSAFAGVALRVLIGEGRATASVTLEHKDPVAGAAAVYLRGGRRGLRRMARLGQRARPAAAGRRRRRRAARAVRAHGRRAHRRRRGRAAAAAARSSAAAPRCRCAARPAGSPTQRRCIAASARSSRATSFHSYAGITWQRCSLSAPVCPLHLRCGRRRPDAQRVGDAARC